MHSRMYIRTGMKITVQKWPVKCQISFMIDLTCQQPTSQYSKRSMLLEEFLLLGDQELGGTNLYHSVSFPPSLFIA